MKEEGKTSEKEKKNLMKWREVIHPIKSSK